MPFLRYSLSLTIFGGAIFAWTTLIGQFQKFLAVYDSIFRFSDCIIPNPIATPCFWGAVAFVVAFIWSLYLIVRPNERGDIWLSRFLLFGVLFALAVLGYEAIEFYHLVDFGGVSVSCAPGVHPLNTPCFTGFLFFLAAFVLSWVLRKVNNNREGR